MGEAIVEARGEQDIQATETGNFPLLAAGVLCTSLALVVLNRSVWHPLHRIADERFRPNR